MKSHFMVARNQDPFMLCYLIGFIVFVAPVLGFIAPKGLTPAVILGGTIGIIILRIQKRQIKWLNKPLIIILLSVCLWSIISCLWAVNFTSAIVGSAKLLGNLIAGGLFYVVFQSLENFEKKLISNYVIAGFIFVLCIIIFEILTGSALYAKLKYVPPTPHIRDQAWLSTAVVVLSLFVWPVILALYKKNLPFQTRKKKVLLLVCTLSSILVISVQIGFLSGAAAVICGIIGASFVTNLGQSTGAKVFIIVIILASLTPFGLKQLENPIGQIKSVISVPYSAEHRLAIWKFTADKIVEKPVKGWGMNASKFIPGGGVFLFSETGRQYGRALPLHPHNVIAQIWLELGLPGIVMFIGLLSFILLKVVKLDYSKFEVAMIFGQIATVLVIANLSFGIWQAWWIATLWLSASVMQIAVQFNFYGES